MSNNTIGYPRSYAGTTVPAAASPKWRGALPGMEEPDPVFTPMRPVFHRGPPNSAAAITPPRPMGAAPDYGYATPGRPGAASSYGYATPGAAAPGYGYATPGAAAPGYGYATPGAAAPGYGYATPGGPVASTPGTPMNANTGAAAAAATAAVVPEPRYHPLTARMGIANPKGDPSKTRKPVAEKARKPNANLNETRVLGEFNPHGYSWFEQNGKPMFMNTRSRRKGRKARRNSRTRRNRSN